jgi:NADPH2:quinone reductase
LSACVGSLGSYTEEKIISADKLVPLPSSVDDVMAASIMLKGMTAQMLLRRVFKVKKGHKIFVHAAAGGVGSLLVQWAKGLGATVIAAVSNEEKAAQAKEDGADHVIIYSQQNFVDRVKEITEGAGVNVVYDAVGKDTLMVIFSTTTLYLILHLELIISFCPVLKALQHIV